jgi:hypothetical protein
LLLTVMPRSGVLGLFVLLCENTQMATSQKEIMEDIP